MIDRKAQARRIGAYAAVAVIAVAVAVIVPMTAMGVVFALYGSGVGFVVHILTVFLALAAVLVVRLMVRERAAWRREERRS